MMSGDTKRHQQREVLSKVRVKLTDRTGQDTYWTTDPRGRVNK